MPYLVGRDQDIEIYYQTGKLLSGEPHSMEACQKSAFGHTRKDADQWFVKKNNKKKSNS